MPAELAGVAIGYPDNTPGTAGFIQLPIGGDADDLVDGADSIAGELQQGNAGTDFQAMTNYIGCNPATKYDSNRIDEDVAEPFEFPRTNDADKLMQWVTVGTTIAAGVAVAITDGLAVAGAGGYTLEAAMVDGDFGWATED